MSAGRSPRLNLNRPIDRLLVDAGFELARVKNHYARGPKPFGYMFEGVATKTARSPAKVAQPAQR